MVAANLRQSSFGGGIVSPQALGRTDMQKYAVGLRECSNAWITRYGTIENRAGTQFVGSVKTAANRVRLVPFVFSSAISYLLEFGDSYIRPYRNGARIDLTGAATWAIGTTYAVGDVVTYMGNIYRALDATTGDQPDISPTIWNPQAGGLLEIITNVPQAALSVLQYVQQADIMTVTAQAFHPQQLLRYSNERWVWQTFSTSNGIEPPINVTVAAGLPSTAIDPPTSVAAIGGIAAPGEGVKYRVTSYLNSPSQESITSNEASLVGLVPSSGSPVTITWTAAAGVTGYAIYRRNLVLSSNPSIIGVTDGVSFVDSRDIVDLNGAHGIKDLPVTSTAGNTLFTYVVTSISAATGAESSASIEGSARGGTPTTSDPNVISWMLADGASDYRVYRIVNGVPGFIGTAGNTNTFSDDNIIPDTSIQPPIAISLFNSPEDFPAVCGYYQQRLMFANTINQPQTVWMSRVGIYSSFSVSTPVQDDDAIQFTIAGKQVQEVRALVDLGKLIVHTSNAEYICTGNQAGTMTPGSIGLVLNGSGGSALLAPVIIGNTDLFIQQSATRILDLRYDVKTFSYSGKDLTKFATDLFAGRTIVDMAWQKLPHSIVWCILDNGTTVGLTYVPEDETWSWHEHLAYAGTFENVTVVAEGTEDVVYTVVRRTIDGAVTRFIERFASRACLDVVTYSDCVFADSSLTYDGRNVGATTMTAAAISGWTTADTISLTASAPAFVATDVGNAVIFQRLDTLTGLVAEQVTCSIVGYTSATVVTAVPQRTVPTWARALPLLTWGKAVRDFSGIDHLEGESLSILADGSVAADPLDTGYPLVTVDSGMFSLTVPAMVVTAGLPIQMDLQTLPVENATGETIANRRIVVRRCTPIFHNSRGGLFGQDVGHLNQWKQAPTTAASFGLPVPAITGPSSVPINGTPELTGQVCVRLTNPVPFGISAIIITGEVMDAA